MVLFNYSTKELTAKVVYYGPGLCGKTTNLQWIHEKLPIKNKGKMLSLATEADRTLFFDFLPIELGTIRGMKTRIQLYTVPGQVFYNATRRMVLKGADCVVFVADSQEPMLDANLDALQNLKENLEANEIDAEEIPTVLQYNKRDLPNALPIEILNERMNPKGLPYYEAVAMKGIGVEETLKGATTLVFRALATKYGGAEAGASPTTTAPVRPAAGAAPPAMKGPTSTLPPVAKSPAPAEEEIDLELPAASEEEFSLPSPAGTEEIALSVDEEPAVMARGDRTDPRIAAKSTAIRGGDDAADLRRRISQPPPEEEPELSLEAIDEEEVEIEELTLDSAPPPPLRPAPVAARPAAPAPAAVAPAPPRAAAPAPAPRPAPSAPAARPAAPPAPPPRPAAVAAPAVRPMPAPARPTGLSAPSASSAGLTGRSAPSASSITTAPVSVQLGGSTGQTDVSIPVEVVLNNGTAQVQIHLRLTLNLKLER
jgi:signal recognition particle receptor subunit beta